MPIGRPSSGPASPAARRASLASAIASACSGVSATKALSALARSIAREMRLRQFARGNRLRSQRVAGLGERQGGEVGQVGFHLKRGEGGGRVVIR